MLELDTTIMTPSAVFETSGHVARFADWMVKDAKTGDVLRADHLVKGVLEARLAGDREARGLAAAPVVEDKKKKKKGGKAAALKLEDAVVQEYESILAKVSSASFFPLANQPKVFCSLTITLARIWENSAENMTSGTLIQATRLENHNNLI